MESIYAHSGSVSFNGRTTCSNNSASGDDGDNSNSRVLTTQLVMMVVESVHICTVVRVDWLENIKYPNIDYLLYFVVLGSETLFFGNWPLTLDIYTSVSPWPFYSLDHGRPEKHVFQT